MPQLLTEVRIDIDGGSFEARLRVACDLAVHSMSAQIAEDNPGAVCATCSATLVGTVEKSETGPNGFTITISTACGCTVRETRVTW